MFYVPNFYLFFNIETDNHPKKKFWTEDGGLDFLRCLVINGLALMDQVMFVRIW